MIGFAPASAHENTHRGGPYVSTPADIVMCVHLFIAVIQAYDTVREHVIKAKQIVYLTVVKVVIISGCMIFTIHMHKKKHGSNSLL